MEHKIKGAGQGYSLQDDGQQSINTCRQASPIPQNKILISMPTDHSLIKSRAFEMFQTGQGADFVIEVMPQIDGQEKKEFNVHKYVLMVNSDVFMAMFSHEDTKEAREGRIKITDSTGRAVRQMLIFMYTGELPKEYAMETDAGPLMHLANKYQIKSLVELIEIEQELVGSLSLTNVFDWLEMANLYHMNALHSACGQLIRRKLYKVKKEAKWLELKKKAPELAFSILEGFAEESGGHPCHHCGGYGHFARNCTNEDDDW